MFHARSKSIDFIDFHLLDVGLGNCCLAYDIKPTDVYCLTYQIYEQACNIFEKTMRQD